jgi:hypothetical protein
MKILIIQENGRHEENRKFRECHNFKRAFDRLGFECEIWGLGHDNYSTPFEYYYNSSDVIFILENYDTEGWVPDLSDKKKLKIFWSIDSHCNPWGNVGTANKHNVDIVLNAIESDKSLFEGRKTFYYPNCYPIDLITPISDIEKKYFMGFCGTPFQYRVNLMNYIEEKLNINIQKDTWVLGDNMVKSINSYNVHLNYSDNDDINYRVFETLGTKTCLLTSKVENLDNLFTDMEDIVMYSNFDEAVEKTRILSENPDLINKISESGYKKVISKHTFDNRAIELIEIIKNNI